MGDSRPDSAMNESARTQSATVRTHTNCALCCQPSNIIGHRIEDCPIIMQHELRFTDLLVNQPPNESSNPTMEPPPPSSSTVESNSISGSIQRQVATMEQTMIRCLDELADNMSQVTDPIDTSFDASVPSSPMPTGWKTGLSRSYQHKLHALPFDQHDNLCDKIDEMAKNLTTTGDTVSYAMFLIDRRIKYNQDAEAKEVERVTTELSSLTDNLSQE